MWRGVTHSANTDVRSARFCDSILPGRKVKIIHTCVHLAQNISLALISSWPHLGCPANCMLDICQPFILWNHSFCRATTRRALKVQTFYHKNSLDKLKIIVGTCWWYTLASLSKELEKGLRAVQIYNLCERMLKKQDSKHNNWEVQSQRRQTEC